MTQIFSKLFAAFALSTTVSVAATANTVPKQKHVVGEQEFWQGLFVSNYKKMAGFHPISLQGVIPLGDNRQCFWRKIYS